MIFSVITERDDLVTDFVIESQARFKSEGYHSFFLKDFRQSINETKKNYIVSINYEIGIPPVFLPFFILLGISLVFDWNFYLKSNFFLGSLIVIFWMDVFHRWVFIKGLKKKGYRGMIKKISSKKALEVSLFESARLIKLA